MHLTTCEQCTRILKAAKGNSLTVSLILGCTHDRNIVSFLRGRNRLRKVQGLDPNPTASKQLTEELCLGSMIKFSPPHSVTQHPQGGLARCYAATLQSHPRLWNQGCLYAGSTPKRCLLTTLWEHGHIKLRFAVCGNLEN